MARISVFRMSPSEIEAFQASTIRRRREDSSGTISTRSRGPMRYDEWSWSMLWRRGSRRNFGRKPRTFRDYK